MSAISSSTHAASSATNSGASASCPIPATDYIKSQVTKVAGFLKSNPLTTTGIQALINAGAGALAAGLFTSLSPLGGALYGLTYTAIATPLMHAMEWISEKTGYQPEHPIMKIGATALPVIAGIAAGCAAVSFAGFALTPGIIVAFATSTIALGVAGAATVLCTVVGAAIHDVYMNPQSQAGSTAGSSTLI